DLTACARNSAKRHSPNAPTNISTIGPPTPAAGSANIIPPPATRPTTTSPPQTERAIDWLTAFQTRPFVATESRLMTVFALLREIAEGTQIDPETRIAE